MNSLRAIRGFTLIEVMVVVFILALLGGISIFALTQGSDRAEQAQAEQLRDWLQSVADRSRLEATSYGVRQEGAQLQVLTSYQRRWWPVEQPEGFSLPAGIRLRQPGQALPTQDEEAPVLLVFREGRWSGNQRRLEWHDSAAGLRFRFLQDDNETQIALEREP